MATMKEILAFLKSLKKNNNKPWFDKHRGEYQTARENFIEIIKLLIREISAFESGVTDLEPGDCIFRINRDIRFTNDKRPYKENFGAYISEGGKKSMKAGYYFHLQPGNESFCGGGIYLPTPDTLKKIRQEIDYNPGPLVSIIKSKNFKKYFGEIVSDQLKRIPKGYSEDHPFADLLKFKSYVVLRDFSDKEVTGNKIIKEVIKTFRAQKPFNDYLNAAVEEQ